MPSDITGTTVLTERPGGGHELRFQPGPLLSSIVLADEINRATPKTQSALLEAMQERQISAGGRTLTVPDPFIVLATQNPIEQEGTYPLPEAQLDRFMVKLVVGYPKEEEYHAILNRTASAENVAAHAVCGQADILRLRAIARQVPVSHQVRTYAIRLTIATQPLSPYAPADVDRYVSLGASPRAAQGLLLLGKVRALLDGRFAVSCEDIRQVAPSVLRHRLVLGFAAQAQKVSADRVIEEVLRSVSEISEKP
jgi:MoxR-like ATPase